jgi:hypothetical protein
MIEQNDPVKEVLMDTVITKIDRQDQKSQDQDKRIAAIENGLGETAQLASDIPGIKAEVRSMAESGNQVKLTDGKLQELNKRLDKVLALLSKPPQSEVRHHHHFPAIAWATAGLFLALCLVSTGWLMTSQKIEQYRAGDFKYRHLKLFVDSSAAGYLFRLDSVYQAKPDSFRNAVEDQERLKQERLDLLDRINSINGRIGQTQDKVGEKEKKPKVGGE